MDIAQIANLNKLPSSYIYTLLIITVILLFGSDDFLAVLALSNFKSEYNIYIGVAFLFLLSISIVNIMKILVRLIKIKTHINTLPKDEEQILQNFIREEIGTQSYPRDNSAVANLIKKEIFEEVKNGISSCDVVVRLSLFGKIFITNKVRS